MKKTKYLILIISTLLILTSCNKKQKIGDILNIDENDIEKIVVSATLNVDGKLDVILEKQQYKEFLDKLLFYEVVEEKWENWKGMIYHIKIETDREIFIQFLDEEMLYIDDKLYTIYDFNKNDLLYLFDDKTQ